MTGAASPPGIGRHTVRMNREMADVMASGITEHRVTGLLEAGSYRHLPVAEPLAAASPAGALP